MNIQTPQIQKMISSIKPMNNLPRYSEEEQLYTNCYAYALGITYPDYGKNFYYPGFTHATQHSDSKSMIKCIEKDLTILGFKFRITDCTEFPIPDEDEYIIKVFISNKTDQMSNGDFHFVRRLPNGHWTHKIGWKEPPCLVEASDGEYKYFGYEPDDFVFLETTTNIIYRYKPICYIGLSR